jgi:hypothetical protein
MDKVKRAAAYRRKAAELRQVAAKFATPDLQDELMDLAARYEGLSSQTGAVVETDADV